MKHLFFLFLALSGCTRPVEKSNGNAQLKAAIDSFYNAVENGDDIKRFSLYSDNIVMMPNHDRLIKGKTALEKAWGFQDQKKEPKYVFRIRNLKTLELTITDNTAYTVNEYDYTYHAEGSAPEWKKTKNVHIWRKQPDGQWKIHLDIWNSSEKN